MKIKEILVLHHSHLDVGYTASQPVILALQREYLDQVLNMLDETDSWPVDSAPKWTCEVTQPVLQWLETAAQGDKERFRAYVRQGRLAVAALRYNTTPLNSLTQLRHLVQPVQLIREELGASVRAAMQHDVNGVQWPLTDLLLEIGVQALFMGVNPHMGQAVLPRPGIFRWQTPKGRTLLVLNGNKYAMFEEILRTREGTLKAMRDGLDEYLNHLSQTQYPHDFLYLTHTAAPYLWDNSPPNLAVAELIRKWNQADMQPRIRYVTAEEMCERLQALPEDRLPVLRGDWTDFWNFGAASHAMSLTSARQATRMLETAQLLTNEFADREEGLFQGFAGKGQSGVRTTQAVNAAQAQQQAYELLARFHEHTWSYWDTDLQNRLHGESRLTRSECQENTSVPHHSVGHGLLTKSEDERLVLDHLKTAYALEARELARYSLISGLEAVARNPLISNGAASHLLLVNVARVAQEACVAVPSSWREPALRFHAQRFLPSDELANAPLFGPVRVPPCSHLIVSLADLPKASSADLLRHVEMSPHRALLESPFHRLFFDPKTGRICSLEDKATGWNALPADPSMQSVHQGHSTVRSAAYDCFDYVLERPDAMRDGCRSAYYQRDLRREMLDASCWHPWHAVRSRQHDVLSVTVQRNEQCITLQRRWMAEGVNELCQSIHLHATTATIELELRLEKRAHAGPEASYLTVPLNLEAGWHCHFDNANQIVTLDDEQLPGACRNWLTVEQFVAMRDERNGAALFCPDAPMVMAGDFHFGPPLERVPRQAAPLLLAWPLNNYWNTNFPLTQAGPIRLRYGLHTHAAHCLPETLRDLAHAFANPLQVHPMFHA